MNEQELDKILDSQRETPINLEAEKQFQQKIRKTMNRTIYGKVLLSILFIAVLAAGLYFGTSAAVDLMFYRPEKETPFLISSDWEGEDFSVLLEDTICMYFPGKYCWMLEPVQSHGFSRYSADLLITDAYGPRHMGPGNAELQISFSKMNLEHAPLSVFALEFLDPEFPYSCTLEERGISSPPDIRQELQNLPESAYLDVSLSFPSSISSDEVARIMNESSDIQVRWLALEGQNTSIYDFAAGGMFTDHLRGQEMTEEAAKKYPNYVLPHEVTGKALEQCLQSRLQMLIDHPEFVSLMETQLGDMISMPRLRERLKNAEENWACYGMRLVGSPAGIQKLMDELSVSYARINDVKISKYEK